jgi:hypothetical protein
VRDSDRLGGNAGAELSDLAYEQIRLPLGHDREQIGDHALRVQPAEEMVDSEERACRSVERKRIELCLEPQVTALRAVTLAIEAGGEHTEPARLDTRMKRRCCREADFMSRSLQRLSNRNQRMEVPQTTQRGKQEAHRVLLPQTVGPAGPPDEARRTAATVGG